MQQLEEKIKRIKLQIEKAKKEYTFAQARLEVLEKQEEDILQELNELGVKPEDLPTEIERLEQEIEEGLKKAWEYLPQELRK